VTVRTLIDLIREVLGDYDTPMGLKTSATDVPSWDSVNHINIIVAAEVAFGIKFRVAELEKLKNIGDFVALLEQKSTKSP
jgi:acyl carrier protein